MFARNSLCVFRFSELYRLGTIDDTPAACTSGLFISAEVGSSAVRSMRRRLAELGDPQSCLGDFERQLIYDVSSRTHLPADHVTQSDRPIRHAEARHAEARHAEARHAEARHKLPGGETVD